MNIIITFFISTIYLPLTIILWVIYGLFCGTIGTTIGTFEFIYYHFSEKYKMKKWFPGESIKLWNKLKDKKEKQDLSYQKEEKEPPVILFLLIYGIWGLVLWPFKVIAGSIIGPILGFIYAIDQWQEVVLKIPIQKRIDYKFKTYMEDAFSWASEEK